MHRSYLDAVRAACERSRVGALAHITGGGIPGNLGRVLPPNLDAVVDTRSWSPPPEFVSLAELSGASAAEMYRVFNMGIGMIAVTSPATAGEVEALIRDAGCGTTRLGLLCAGTGAVRLDGLDGGS